MVDEDEVEAPPGKKTLVQQLVELAEEEFELFVDERESYYAAHANGNGTRVMSINSKELDFVWRDLFRKETGQFVNNEQMSNAKAYISATALRTAKSLKNRFNCTDSTDSKDGIFVHLSDPGHFVEIKPRTINEVKNGPIQFRNFKHQKSLSFSTPFKNVQETLRYLNVSNPTDGLLLLVWLVLAPFENIARPILVFHGPQGSAKTTAARILRDLLDPSTTPVLTPKENQTEWALALFQHAIPIFDNLTKIHNWQADMLCKAVTGDGISKRTLFTDEDTTILSYQRAIIMSGINIPSVQPDLLDRCLLIELERISPENRKQESVLWREFNKDKPHIVGGLFQTISRTLRMYNPKKKIPLTRMADFAALGCAAARAMGFTEKMFLDALQSNLERQHQTVFESQPLARAIVRLVDKYNGEWVGTSSDLASDVKDIVGQEDDEGDTDFAPNLWQPNTLGRKLRELQATFIDFGIKVWFEKRGVSRTRLIHLARRTDGTPQRMNKSAVRAVRTVQKGGNIKQKRTATDSKTRKSRPKIEKSKVSGGYNAKK